MAAAKKKKTGRSARPDFRWIALIFLVTVLISALMSFVSSNLLEGAGLILSFVVLICIVLTGILFDIIGVAVTAADEVPFHAMASRKVPEAEDALRLIRNAGRVSSFCNDVIGDICGVISGSAAAVISARGGKACGKSLAMNSSTAVVRTAAKVLCFFRTLPQRLEKKSAKK